MRVCTRAARLGAARGIARDEYVAPNVSRPQLYVVLQPRLAVRQQRHIDHTEHVEGRGVSQADGHVTNAPAVKCVCA